MKKGEVSFKNVVEGYEYTIDGNNQKYLIRVRIDKKTDPNWPTTPAFGAGCSSPLFNDMRKKIVTDYKNRKL